MFPTIALQLLAIAILSLPQVLADNTDCWRECLAAQNVECSPSDLPCHCTASSGTFLPSVIVCARTRCNQDLNVDILLAPFLIACGSAGQPIPQPAWTPTAKSIVTQFVTVVVPPTPINTPAARPLVTNSPGMNATITPSYRPDKSKGGGGIPEETDGPTITGTLGGSKDYPDGGRRAGAESWLVGACMGVVLLAMRF